MKSYEEAGTVQELGNQLALASPDIEPVQIHSLIVKPVVKLAAVAAAAPF